MSNRIISGIQPTGKPHLGNYLGMLKQCVALQQQTKDELLFFIADLHALTTPQHPKTFAKETLDIAIDLLALGVDPERATLFVQSHVPEHTELAWLFSTITPVGELQRMTQYKEKASRNMLLTNTGLLTYPILMAADIALYKSTLVPVGDDQLQHLELARSIVRRFTKHYGQLFPEPKPRLTHAARIMSLGDPTKKMSKSLGERTYIALTDAPDVIRRKLGKAVTATAGGRSMDPGVANLFTILREVSVPATIAHFEQQQKVGTIQYAELKQRLAEDLIAHLAPYRERRAALQDKTVFVKTILEEGRRKATSIAQQTMQEVREKVGLLR